MAQGSATAFTEQWIEGQVSRTSPLVDATLSNEDGTISKITHVQIKGTDPNRQGKKPVAAFTFQDFHGIITHAQGVKEKALLTGVIEIETGKAFTVLREGYMVVRLDALLPAPVAYDDPVFFVHTAGTAGTLFSYLKANPGGGGAGEASKIPALYKGSGDVGDLVEIYVNFAMKIGIS